MVNDNYMPCEAYENQPAHAEFADFVAFQDAKSKEFFFAMVDAKGKVVMKSEGYPLEKSRETGIKAVIKNRDNQKHFSVKSEGGEFFVSLRAGNYKEIARSCPFKTEKAAQQFIDDLFAVETAPKASKKPAASKAKKATSTATKATKTAAKPTASKTTKKTAVKEAAPVVEAFGPTTVKGTKVQPAYQNVETYLGHATLHDEYGPTGYAKFMAENKFFFVVYNPDRSIYLRSEGFGTEAKRDEKFAAVQQNIVNPEQYEVREIADRFAVALVDEKQNEIARSVEFESFTEAFRTTPKGRVRNEGVVLY